MYWMYWMYRMYWMYLDVLEQQLDPCLAGVLVVRHQADAAGVEHLQQVLTLLGHSERHRLDVS